MASVFVAAALLAITPGTGADLPADAALDLRCYRLMADLAEDQDPRIRAAGLTGAQYFLGRIDARRADFDPSAGAVSPEPAEAREGLVRRCGAMMGAGGRDFRAIGDNYQRRGPAI